MDHIAKHLTISTQSAPNYEKLPDSTRSLKVWAQLADMFGKAFFRENGSTPGRLWDMAIHRLTDQQLAAGLAKLGNDGLQFPPNLSMFIAACKYQPPVRHLGVPQLPLSDTDLKKNSDRAWADMERLSGKKLRPS
jgi:hypothetical protein